MFNVALIGKTYNDTIVFVDRCYMGETNDCNKIVERRRDRDEPLCELFVA